MKKIIKNTLYIVFIVTLFSSCSYNRMADLTIISNKNINFDKDYVLIQANVVTTVSTRKIDALEIALDKLTDSYKGIYLMDAKISIRKDGSRLKIEGDVYGLSK